MSGLDLVFSDLGEQGLLCEYPPGPLDAARQARVWSVAAALAAVPGVTETIPGMNNLAVLFDPDHTTAEALEARIAALWAAPVAGAPAARVIEIPVVYGGAAGPDLAALAAGAGMTAEAFARAHAAGRYTVFALGAQPGFGYLGGLDPRLAAARRTEINPRVEAGSVIIGGAQTAVQARTTPSGWHIIGRTEMTFFDPQATPPARLAPGDEVRFRLIEVLA